MYIRVVSLINLFLLIYSCLFCDCLLQYTNANKLSEIFIENLRVDPKLLADHHFSSASKEFVDLQLENYIKLKSYFDQGLINRSKRNVQKMVTNSVELTFHEEISKNTTDITWFKQNFDWYAAFLENSTNLVIYKFLNQSLLQAITQTKVSTGSKLASYNFQNVVILPVISVDSLTVYIFDKNTNNVQQIQTIQAKYIIDASIWEHDDNLYLSPVLYKNHDNQFEIQSPIYRWHGKYFDKNHNIETSGTKKILPFTIGPAHYISTANYISDDGASTYSEIFKYDLNTETYEPYQRILTKSCIDIDFFTLNVNSKEEHFLIELNENSNSILYIWMDNYFIPFQSIEENQVLNWLPLSVGDKNHNYSKILPKLFQYNKTTLLLGHTKSNIIMYFFNGWNFERGSVINAEKNIMENIETFQILDLKDELILVLQSKYSIMNYKLHISLSSGDSDEYERLLDWCQVSLNSMAHMNEIVDSRADIEEDETDGESESINNMEEISSTLKHYEKSLSDLKTTVINLGKDSNGDIHADEIVINNDAFIDELSVDLMNTVNIDHLMANKIDTKEGFNLTNSVVMNSVNLTEGVRIETLKNLIRKNDSLNLHELKVNGTVSFEKPLTVESINKKTWDSDSLLLVKTPQDLSHGQFNKIKVNSMTSVFINSLNIVDIQKELISKDTVEHLTELNVENLFVGGFINNVDVPILKKYALEKIGNQVIHKSYYFEFLKADNVDVFGLLNNKQIPEELVLTNEGVFKINQDIRFTQSIMANNLTATNLLNNIPVKKGKLDILLRKSKNTQYISGEKTFDNVELVNLISLRGKIESPEFQVRNPVVHIDQEVVIENDVWIGGNVTVEQEVSASNYLSTDEEYSAEKVSKLGLPLTATEIPNALKFQQQLNVDQIFLDKINNLDVDNFVVNGNNQTQIITGEKKIFGDLEITGNTNVFKMNNINLPELEANVMNQIDDQTVYGKHIIHKAAVETELSSNHIHFGANAWSDVLTVDEEQILSGTVTINNKILVNDLEVNSLTINGLLNDQNFTEIIGDAVMFDCLKNITGTKSFKYISTNSLKVKDGDISKFGHVDEKLRLDGEVVFKDLQVSNINVSKSCNGLDKQLLDSLYTKGSMKNLFNNCTVKNITIFGNAFVQSQVINDVVLEDLLLESVKIDEPFRFSNAVFNQQIEAKEIISLGHIERVDLENIVGSTDEEILLYDDIVFTEDVTINGTSNFNALVNNIDFHRFCNMANNKKSVETFIIEGNAFFVKNPSVEFLNNHSVPNILSSAWLQNKPAILTGQLNFSKVVFEDDTNVNGYVNDINVRYINENYFSKSKNQTVYSTVYFDGNVLFEKDVTGSEIEVSQINQLNIKDFVKTAILNDFDQLFEDKPLFESLTVEKLEGNDYLINNLLFDTDVMRYDKSNIITGPKYLTNMKVNNLKASPKIFIQNVNIVDFLQNAVLKSGSNSVPATKHFQNVEILGSLGIIENLNMHKFSNETILQRDINQAINSTKVFTNINSNSIKFKTIKLRNLLNNVPFEELVHNQAKKSSENSFKSKMNFKNDIKTPHLVIGHLYKDINITTVISNLTRLSVLNNFKDNFKTALMTIEEIKRSLLDQPFVIEKYKEVMVLSNLHKVMSFKCKDLIHRLLTFRFENEQTVADVYEWNRDKSIFVRSGSVMDFGLFSNFLDQVTLNDKTFLLVERRILVSSEVFQYQTLLIEIDNSNHYEVVTSFSTSGISYVTSITIPQLRLDCMVLVDQLNLHINIICLNNGSIRPFQSIHSPGVKMVSVINVANSPHLVVLNEISDQEQYITMWKLDNITMQFEVNQILFQEKPRCITTEAFTKDDYFFASAFGHPSAVAIHKFNTITNKFEMFQTLDAEHYPIYIKMKKLASNELVLYVLGKEMFTVYRYEGVAGFVKLIQSGSITDGEGPMDWFSVDNQHFIIIKHGKEIAVVQGIFNRLL